MRHFWALTALQMKINLGLGVFTQAIRGKGKVRRQGIGAIVAIVLVAVAVISAVTIMMNGLFEMAVVPVLQQTLFAVALLASMIVVLIFGLFYAISLYYAKDTEFLLSLPLGRYTAFASKFTVAMIGEIGSFALIMVPALLAYANNVDVNFMFYVKGLMLILFGPMIPFALANVLAAGMMRLSIISRHKDKIAVIGGFLLLVGYMFANQYLSTSLMHMDTSDLYALLNGGLIQAVTAAFPPALWAAKALVYSGSTAGLNLALFLGVSIAAFVACVLFAGRMYQRSAGAQGEAAKKQKKVDSSTLGQSQKKPITAVFIKEWRSILRSPTYAMNALATVIMAPLMIAVLLFTPMEGVPGGMSGLLSQLDIGKYALLMVVVGTAYNYFISSMNTAAMTCYSREGEAYWLMMVLPQKQTVFLMGKFLCGLSITVLSLVLSSLAFIFVMGIPLWIALAAAGLALAVGLAPLVLMVWVDLRWPKIHWDNERKAMKGNMNAVIGMLIAWGIGAAIGLGGVWLFANTGMSLLTVVGVVGGVALAVGVVLLGAFLRSAQKLMQQFSQR